MYPTHGLPSVSAPIPLASYSAAPHSSEYLSHAAFAQPAFPSSSALLLSNSAHVTPPPFFTRQTSTSATMSESRYGAYPQATPLSTSSLDQGTVYRGVFHQQEPTTFAQPQQSLWQAQQTAQDQAMWNSQKQSKLELTSSDLYQPTAFHTAAAAFAPIPSIDLPAVPSHVERFTSFYSAAVPLVIAKSLRIGFQTMSEMRVDYAEDAAKMKVSRRHARTCSSCRLLADLAQTSSLVCADRWSSLPFPVVRQFRGQLFTEDNESIQFIARVYKAGSGAPAPYLVEFQRRSGDAVSWFRFFQKMLKSCTSIHHGPYESTFGVSGMQAMPNLTTQPTASSPSLGLPNMQALCLDLPTVSSLANMVASDCIESKRESAKLLAKVACQTDLFPCPPPSTLERQQSSPSAQAASQAIWSAIVNILTSNDAECARLGASILRNSMRQGEADMLLTFLEQQPQVVQHLIRTLEHCDQDGDAIESREIRRQVAAVLTILIAKERLQNTPQLQQLLHAHK